MHTLSSSCYHLSTFSFGAVLFFWQHDRNARGMELELSDESTREAVWLNVADIRTAVIHSEEHRKQLWNDDTKYVKLTPSTKKCR